MKIIVTKEDTLLDVASSVGTSVSGKFLYIPGWFEILEDETLQFHHMNKLPEELKGAVEEIQKSTTKETKKK